MRLCTIYFVIVFTLKMYYVVNNIYFYLNYVGEGHILYNLYLYLSISIYLVYFIYIHTSYSYVCSLLC